MQEPQQLLDQELVQALERGSRAAAGSGSASPLQQLQQQPPQLRTRVVGLDGQRQQSRGAASDAGPRGDDGGCGEVGDVVAGDDDAGDGQQLPRRHCCKQPSFWRHL